jgi:hypothetical protein
MSYGVFINPGLLKMMLVARSRNLEPGILNYLFLLLQCRPAENVFRDAVVVPDGDDVVFRAVILHEHIHEVD